MANGLLFGSRRIIVEMARYDSGFKRGDSTRFGSGSQNHEISRVPNAKIPHIQDDFRAPRVRGRNYSARIWEEDCDDPFNEKHIHDWINNHISIPVTNPKSKEDVTGWDGDLAEKKALDKPNLAELEAKSADKAVTEGNLTSTLLLKDGNSRIVHVPREDVIISNATAQEAEESIVGESLANNNQPIGNKEQEVMHNQCVISNPDVQIMLQNVTNEAVAGKQIWLLHYHDQVSLMDWIQYLDVA
ncbi:hypothetical protein RHSIM_Rhsim11G0007400 [Rhododendron simsii]|uniref:Uncharacterized protein n=1 Tax=Rhododendron simsii TaxID=118357 RepID=A0A834LB05_RHOSS|nr:hypothetical protein RHSIM_Rhsim11G0007400 [Rhododendron simsii]